MSAVRVMAWLLLGLAPTVALAAAAGPDDVAALYQSRCAGCHAAGAGKAPALAAMRQMPAERVFFALSNGIMKSQAQGLGLAQIGALTGYASAGDRGDYQPAADTFCSDRTPHLSAPQVTQWGFGAGHPGRLEAPVTTLDAPGVRSLSLAWAFALPGTTEARSQPVATADTLFVAASPRHVFALDRRTGCIRWHRAVGVRNSLTLGRAGSPGRTALLFGDGQGFVTALDAADGSTLWRQRVGLFEVSMVTGAIIQHGNRLIVPISSLEVGLAANPAYECCRTHGGVRALDAASGDVLWSYHTTADAVPQAANAAGTRQWGPSGAPVWGAPTVDAARGVVYAGTGQNYSSPASGRSDAIVALDLADGTERWHFQATSGDAYNVACDGVPPGPGCPAENGPDFDFGAAVVQTADSRGRALLIAAQKSGDVWALDPDAEGEVVWHTTLGGGSKLGGVHWGIAVAEGRVFVPIADPPLPRPGYAPRPGWYALDVDDGAVVWTRAAERGCQTDLMAYFQRSELYPQCSFWYGPSNAPLVLPGVLISGTLDGTLHALSTADGGEIWSLDTVQAFDAVNGIAAHGGSIDAGAAIAVGDMLYLQSGYGLFGHLPGNVLLALTPSVRRDGATGR